MTPPGEVMSQLRTRIQQAVTTVCELEVTYKCSLQIFGVLCFSIDDDDNELVIKIQKKWCKAFTHEVSDNSDVTRGVNATHVCHNDSRTFSECCKQNKRSLECPSGQHLTGCDITEAADNFPRSFRPIPSNDVSYERNPLLSIGGVRHGVRIYTPEDGDSQNVRKSYPLCPYDLCSHFPEVPLRGPDNMQQENKGAFVKHSVSEDSPLACKWSRHTDEKDAQTHTANLVHLTGSEMRKATVCDTTTSHGRSASRELSVSSGVPGCVMDHSLGGYTCPNAVVCDKRPVKPICESKPAYIHRLKSASTENFTGFTQSYELAARVAPAEQKRRMFIPTEVLASAANAEHTHRSMFSRKLFALASHTDAKLHGTARNGKGKIRRRTPVGGRGRRLPDRPLVGQKTMAQCFGITKNKRLTYTTEEQVELEHGGFARAMQRLLCRPPLRVDGTLVDATQRSVSDDATGDYMMENIQSVDGASHDHELDLSRRAMPPHGRLSNSEIGCVDTTWDDVDKTTGNINIAVLQHRQERCHERESNWKMHKVAYDNDESECGTVEHHAQTANIGDHCGENLPVFLLNSESEAIGGVDRSDNITVSQAHEKETVVHGVCFASNLFRSELGDENKHQCASVSVTNRRSDVAEAALTEACCDKEENMSSDTTTGVILSMQCHKPDGKVTETASGNAEVSKPVSHSDSCANDNQNKDTFFKTCRCSVDTNYRMTSIPILGGTDIVHCASEKVQKTGEDSCKTDGVMPPELCHSNRMPPMKTCLSQSENACREYVHQEDNSQKCHSGTDDGVSISVCRHATDEDFQSNKVMTFAMQLVDDICRNDDAVTECLQQGEIICDHGSLVTDDRCQDVSVNPDCTHIGSDTHGNPQDPGEDPRRSETPTHPVPIPMSVKSYEQNLTPGKHVRNLFPEHREYADFTRSKDAMCVVNKDLFLNNFPAIRMSARVTGSSLVNDSGDTLENARVRCSSASSKLRGTANGLPAKQMSTVPCDDEIPIVSEDSFPEFTTAAVCVTPDKDILAKRLVCLNEPKQKFHGFGTIRVAPPNTLSSSVAAGVSGANLLSPLTRPPIHRIDRNDTIGHSPMSSLSEESQLYLHKDSKHGMLPNHNKETRVQCLDGLLKCGRPVNDELEKMALANVSGSHADSISLGCRLSGEETQLKTTDPDSYSSEVTEATPPDQRVVPNTSNKELQGDKTGISQLLPTSGVSDMYAAPCAKSRFTAESQCQFGGGYSADGTESCGGSSESCSDCSGASSQLVNVTGSWTIVADPDSSNSLPAISRPLVTVTSFNNIQYKDVRFNSSTDKNAAGVSDAVYLPCAVKENRGAGFLRRSQPPKTRATNRRGRWKWPANLLRTISRKSHVVAKRHLGATPESVCLENVKVKGHWTRKWGPSSGYP